MHIQLDDVHFAYAPDAVALRGVTLAIPPGDTVAVIGANGAGKTTLVKHLNGLLKPTRGRVTVGDWQTGNHTVAQLARRVGLVFQNPDDQLFKQTVADEVAFGPRNLGLDAAAVQQRVDAALAAVGLADVAAVHPYDLPTSQRKLVALATILALEPPVVVLDEPTIGQDGRGLRRLGEIIGRLHATGRTIITISHDIDFCADNFNRIVVMSGGRVLADGPTAAVFARHDVLRQANVAPPQLVRLADRLGLDGTPTTVDRFVQALRAQRTGKTP